MSVSNKPKKICALFSTVFVRGSGGGTVHNAEIWRRMPKLLNAEVHFIVYTGKTDDRINAVENLKVIEAPVSLSHKMKIDSIKDISNGERFIAYANLFRFGKVRHIFLLLYQIYAIFYCLRLHNLVLIYERYTSLSLAGVISAKLCRVPLVVEVNGIPKLERGPNLKYPRLSKLRDVIEEIFERIIFNSSDRIIVVTPSIKEFLVTNYDVPPINISVIPNGVNPSQFRPIDQRSVEKSWISMKT